ncbi:outer membrane beta-barrel protein [Steroidobacter sp.]|uniref:outer membrane beta-barrel protein n=1 Tax=Steroidobacter sp. TaxID=1978227 RepID=UPI001A578F7D|nr:outer membrane beta-barrel protein [Steroidobacter sp.]MBL8269994.1 porin family protein [Steroidobacter sp.]
MRKAILATLLLVASGATMAADNGIYLGASIGDANIDIKQGLAQVDSDDTGYKFIAGIRPLDWFGIEASYVNFGKPKDGSLAADADGISGFGVFFLPAGPVDVFVKGGLISFDSSISVDGVGDIYRKDGTDFAYGVGVQFRLLSLGIRAEYEKFEIDNVKDANMLSIGVTYTFL